MKRLRFPALALLLMAYCLLLLFLFSPKKEYSPTEKRYLAESPSISVETLKDGTLSEDIEDYVSDHFPGRNFFVGVNAYWNLLTGRNTAENVYYGKDGYLIRAPEKNSLKQLQTNLSRFETFAVAEDLPATLLMIPTAGDVMEEKLPEHHAPYLYEDCYQLAQRICNKMATPELKSLLRKAAADTQIYYKTDHHLTSAGCHTIYQLFCKMHGRAALSKKDYTITPHENFHGTTWASSGYWMTEPDTLETWDSGAKLNVTIMEADQEDTESDTVFFTDNLKSDDLYTVFLDGNHSFVKIENPSSDGGTLLLLRDSYGHCMAPFLAENYYRILLVDLRYYRASLSELVKEYNVTEMAVLYGLDSLLTDTNSAWIM